MELTTNFVIDITPPPSSKDEFFVLREDATTNVDYTLSIGEVDGNKVSSTVYKFAPETLPIHSTVTLVSDGKDVIRIRTVDLQRGMRETKNAQLLENYIEKVILKGKKMPIDTFARIEALHKNMEKVAELREAEKN